MDPAQDRSSSRHGIAVAALVAAMLLLANAAAVWHPLHEWLHGEAGHEDHECAITLMLHGQMDTGAAAAIATPPVPLVWMQWVSRECTAWVPGIYLINAVLEHAPPGPV